MGKRWDFQHFGGTHWLLSVLYNCLILKAPLSLYQAFIHSVDLLLTKAARRQGREQGHFKATTTTTTNMPSCKEIFSGNAGCVWNVVCCPIVAPIYLIWKSFMVYVGPCMRVLCQRCAVGCLWRYLFPCCFTFEDDEFFGSKAVGTGDAVTWVRAQDLDGIRGKVREGMERECPNARARKTKSSSGWSPPPHTCPLNVFYSFSS